MGRSTCWTDSALSSLTRPLLLTPSTLSTPPTTARSIHSFHSFRSFHDTKLSSITVMSIIASPTTDTADAVFPSSTSWVDKLVYPVDPVTVLPHVHLYRLYRGEQIVVPSAALDLTILATALRAALSMGAPPSAVRAVGDPTTDRRVLNDALFACYNSSFISERTADILQPWLLLVLMSSPTDDGEEHSRVTAQLKVLCTRRRDAVGALRCTAKLLCMPDLFCTLLRLPVFRWHYLSSQSNITAVLAHLRVIVSACVLASTEKEITLREVGRIVSEASPPAPTSLSVPVVQLQQPPSLPSTRSPPTRSHPYLLHSPPPPSTSPARTTRCPPSPSS